MLFTRQPVNKRIKRKITTNTPRVDKRPLLTANTKSCLREVFLPPVLGFCAIYLVTAVTALSAPSLNSPVLACSMGASAVLLFVSPTSRFSTPWSLFGGHLFSALAGIICAIYIPDFALCAATAVGGSILVMKVFRCTNPPGAATALAPVIMPHNIDLLIYGAFITPLLINVLVLLLFSIFINKLIRFAG